MEEGVEIDRNDGLSASYTEPAYLPRVIDSASAIFSQDRRNGETEERIGDILSPVGEERSSPVRWSVSTRCDVLPPRSLRRVRPMKKGVVKLEAGQAIAESASSL